MVGLKRIYFFFGVLCVITAIVAVTDTTQYLKPLDALVFFILTGISLLAWSQAG
jgi:hypothetical protein